MTGLISSGLIPASIRTVCVSFPESHSNDTPDVPQIASLSAVNRTFVHVKDLKDLKICQL